MENIMNDEAYPFDRFVESIYLKLNPDVFEAVQNRSFFSGWEHYVAYGFSENRPGVPVELNIAIKNIMEEAKDNKLSTPEHLRKRVHGVEDIFSFLLNGRLISQNIHSSINSIMESGAKNRILDFGCGCGRVIGYLHELYGNSSFYGTDIDQEAISWCQHQLPETAEFFINGELPPLSFDSEFFDFVYSISVFTHLPEDMQFSWLEELRRVTRQGGYLLLTTHGEDLFNTSSEKSLKLFREKGFYYSTDAGTEGLPDFYQTSFHTEDYIYTHWGKFFEIIKIVKRGIAGHQDLILCRKSNSVSLMSL
jgi:ubiquinone/menaquinone biosynthesis C-methylase UbiE